MGAFIVQHFHWSLVFWINLPIGCCAMYLLWRYFPEQRHPRRHALDLAGTAWLAIGITALLLSLLQAEWLGRWVLLLLAIAVLSGFYCGVRSCARQSRCSRPYSGGSALWWPATSAGWSLGPP